MDILFFDCRSYLPCFGFWQIREIYEFSFEQYLDFLILQAFKIIGVFISREKYFMRSVFMKSGKLFLSNSNSIFI